MRLDLWPRDPAAREKARERGKFLLIALAIGLTIVLGVASFVSGGPPSAPSVTLAREIPAPSHGELPQLELSISTHTFSLQPINSIDELGARITFSAWGETANGTNITLVLDSASALYITDGAGDFYTLSTLVLIPLAPYAVVETVTMVVRAQVPTYVADYFSESTVVEFGINASDGQMRVVATGAPVTTAAHEQERFNAYGPLVGMASFDLLAVAGAVFEGRARRNAAIAGAGGFLLLLVLYIVWVRLAIW